MAEIILSAVFIDEENLSLTKQIFRNKLVHNFPLGFEVGNVVVNQTIHTPDLFDPRFKITHEAYWLTTREDFDKKFNIVDDANRTDHFALITRK